MQVLVREQEILYWTISDVPDQRLLSLIVLIMALTFITVVTVKMLEQFALVRPVFCAILYTMFFYKYLHYNSYIYGGMLNPGL